ncbi:MAG: SIS domain-containing protein [Candidatus Krumholzibacteriia bacterium]
MTPPPSGDGSRDDPDLLAADLFTATVAELRDTLDRLDEEHVRAVQALVDDVLAAWRAGGKLLVCGNGGSAADSQHIAAELVGRYLVDRPALAAVALTTDTSTLTAVANDCGYDRVFARQVEALGRSGDVLLVISTSGNSGNCVEAAAAARRRGLRTHALLGGDGGRLRSLVDGAFVAPSAHTPRIQEVHITAAHLVCDLLERRAVAEGLGRHD